MFKKPQNMKGLTVNFVLGYFKQYSRVQFFLFCFIVEFIFTLPGPGFEKLAQTGGGGGESTPLHLN